MRATVPFRNFANAPKTIFCLENLFNVFHEIKCKVVPEHVMKTDVGVEVELHSFLTRKGLILSIFTNRFNVTNLKSCTLNLCVFRLVRKVAKIEY